MTEISGVQLEVPFYCKHPTPTPPLNGRGVANAETMRSSSPPISGEG